MREETATTIASAPSNDNVGTPRTESNNVNNNNSSINAETMEEGGHKDGRDTGGYGSYQPPAKNGLLLTSFYLSFNTLATGAFAVPSAFDTLGLIGGILSVILIFFLCWFAMHRLYMLRQIDKDTITTYEAIGQKYLGGAARAFLLSIIYIKIFLGGTSEFLLTASTLLKQMTEHPGLPTGLCFTLAAFVICVIALFPGQFRSVHTYTLYVSVPGLLTVIIALAITWVLIPANQGFALSERIVLFGSPTLWEGATALGDISYSFAGAVVFIEGAKPLLFLVFSHISQPNPSYPHPHPYFNNSHEGAIR